MHRLETLGDQPLIDATEMLVERSVRCEAELLAHIGEIDRRGLFRQQACSTMFAYCTERLGLSESMAYKRIQVARLARRFPQVLEALVAERDRRVHLSGLCVLAPHICADNVDDLLSRAGGKSRRQIERLVAEVAPRPDVPERVRKLPRPASTAPRAEQPPRSEPPTRRPVLEPLAPARYRIELTADQELYDNIEKARDLLSHRIGDRDLNKVFGWAMKVAVAELLRQRFAETDRPQKVRRSPAAGSRYIPAAVRRAVYVRDEGRCTFVDSRGRRCSARSKVELHHQQAFARGGPATVDNLTLRCQAHNQLQAELDFAGRGSKPPAKSGNKDFAERRRA